jgi:hypothetical protein
VKLEPPAANGIDLKSDEKRCRLQRLARSAFAARESARASQELDASAKICVGSTRSDFTPEKRASAEYDDRALERR